VQRLGQAQRRRNERGCDGYGDVIFLRFNHHTHNRLCAT
jgi:hypothetical protein